MEITTQKKLGGYCPRCFSTPCTCLTSEIPSFSESHVKDKEDESDSKKSTNAWRMLYRFMDDVKTYMDLTIHQNQERITIQDVHNTIQYVNNGIRNIIKNTIGNKDNNHYIPNQQEFAKMWNICDEYHSLSLRNGWTWQEAVDFLQKHWNDPDFNLDYTKELDSDNI